MWFEDRTRQSIWNMQRSFQVSLNRQVFELDERARDKGVEERSVLPRHAALGSPLATTIEPSLRLGPVPIPMLVSDVSYAILQGPLGPHGLNTPYGTEDPDLVGLAAAAFLETWEAAIPWQEAGLRPPLEARRFRIAVMLMDGHTDRGIAAELGTSLRTVSSEVRAIVDWLGARNRGHAVAMLVGAA
ncbi:helix-turn-helix transcriptional regulator [Phycicoccus sp. HDW14]|uniref:helix-turn-helix transcriptional regulator n=1 Tax=Phycicoccus sp. HDW14 TaxID=2714941 RepID=UPI00140A4573|nr:helix-turn-helix transcriptional regulator [Phycicoccus sp. HDW14]QIM21171.1 helix-turn-helix transcriptional regulator [Phycicoccus sp. HDW14]